VDDPRQRRPDITLAQTELHWTPKVRLEQGLVRTIAYFEDRLRRQPPLSANVAAAPAD
jgi:UDP-glucuronate decarboxylase